ncbi:T9SS type A sorting domain-containing protein [Mariniflexile soesokkakense]|uniref:T9SS type A sorting domain-containing protein n=1 Tax=Mariniflexile soesokkakense TaxID=1343160 RepID=A0ABV0AEE6_9FLAO
MTSNYFKPFILILVSISCMVITAQTPNFSMVGFATLGGGTTGGTGGTTVTPTTLEELRQYVENASTPYIIRINKEFNTGVQTWVDVDGGIVASGTPGAIETTFGAILKVGSNKTLIGIGDQAFLNRIGLVIQCQSNIIIRNIKFTMKYVPATRDGEYKILDTDGVTTLGDPDCIGIQADKDSIPEPQRISQHIWIDHCEFYNENITNKDRYDGLVDNKNNTQHLTISWNYFHDHSKALLSGSGNSDNYNRTITFHHNYFARIDGSRLPLLRFGQHHYFNNYMEDCPGDGVNLRINTNAYIEQNYFKNAKKPIFGKLSENGQGKLIDNIFENCSRLPAGYSNINGGSSSPLSEGEEFVNDCNFTPSTLYNYTAALHATVDVPTIVKTYSGVGKIDDALNVNSESALNKKVLVKDQIMLIKAEPETSVVVFDLNGRIVFKTKLKNNLNHIPLNIKGLYIIKLSKNNKATNFKVVF